MHKIDEMILSIKDFTFTKSYIDIFFHETDLKLHSRMHGNGYHWFLVYPDGSETMLSSADVNETLKNSNFTEIVQKFWNKCHDIVQDKLDEHKSKLRDEEKDFGKRFHRMINRITERTTESNEIPNSLKEITNIKKLNAEYTEAIVYFLLHKDKIVYVGQTKSEWPSRIRQHMKDQKIFDQVYYIQVGNHEVDQQEQYYIKKFKPKYNKAHNE